MTKLVSDASPFPIACIGVQLRHLMEMAKSYKKNGKYYHYTFKTFMSMRRVTYILNVGMATCKETQLIGFGCNQV